MYRVIVKYDFSHSLDSILKNRFNYLDADNYHHGQ